MSVTEYHDRFLQLARYAPADVADDRKKWPSVYIHWVAFWLVVLGAAL